MNLIIDRTTADTAYVKTRAHSKEPLKGAYNAEDYNRVGKALNYLSGLLYEHGYGFNPNLREDWSMTENMSYQDAAAYLNTIKTLKGSFFSLPKTPELPSDIHDLFDFGGHEKANDIERILLDIQRLIEWMTASFHYSDQFYSGERVELAGIRFVQRRTMGELQQYTMAELSELQMQELMYGWQRERKVT